MKLTLGHEQLSSPRKEEAEQGAALSVDFGEPELLEDGLLRVE